MRNYKRRNSFGGNKKKKSNLDYQQLTKSASQETIKPYEAQIEFSEMDLNSVLKANILSKGFSKPTEIQEATYTHVEAGENVI